MVGGSEGKVEIRVGGGAGNISIGSRLGGSVASGLVCMRQRESGIPHCLITESATRFRAMCFAFSGAIGSTVLWPSVLAICDAA